MISGEEIWLLNVSPSLIESNFFSLLFLPLILYFSSFHFYSTIFSPELVFPYSPPPLGGRVKMENIYPCIRLKEFLPTG